MHQDFLTQVEALTTYILNISAQDEGGLSTITQIILRINDTNNNRPVFDKSHYELAVLEGDYDGAELGVVHAEDGDFYENGRVTYELAEGNSEPGLFRVEEGTGAVRVWGSLDREETSVYSLTLVARDHGDKPLTSSVNVTVTVLDQNDNQPLFFGYDRLMPRNGLHTVPVYSSHINSYRVDAGVRVAEVYANDTDSASAGNGIVEFRLTDHTNVFYIHPDSGELTTLVPIGEAYNITVQATDQGRPPRHATAEVHLTLRQLPGGAGGSSLRERPRSSGGVVGDKQNLIVRPPFESEQKKELLKVRKLADKARSSTVAPQTLEDLTEEVAGGGGEWTPTEATEASPKPPHPLPVGQMFRQEVKNSNNNNTYYILHSLATKRYFLLQVYSIDVRENVAVPRLLLDLGREVVGGEGMPVHYRLLQKDHLSALLHSCLSGLSAPTMGCLESPRTPASLS